LKNKNNPYECEYCKERISEIKIYWNYGSRVVVCISKKCNDDHIKAMRSKTPIRKSNGTED